MSREGILSVKEKWALDAQLGELLRGLEPVQDEQSTTSPNAVEPLLSQDEQFQSRLASLMEEFKLNIRDAVDIAQLLC